MFSRSRLRNDVAQEHKFMLAQLAFVSAVLVLIFGTLLQILRPQAHSVFLLRLLFSFLFLVLCYVSIYSRFSVRLCESAFALIAAFIVSHSLRNIIQQDFLVTWILSSTVVTLGVCGILIHYTSYFILVIPHIVFCSYLFPIDDTANPKNFLILVSFVFSVVSCTIGFFLTWQKIKLVNKIIAHGNKQNMLIENLNDGVLMHDPTGQILALNEASANILGFTKDQILGKTNANPQWKVFETDGETPLPPEKHPSSIATTTGKLVKNTELVLERSDKSRKTLEVSAAPIKEHGMVTSVVVTFRDISEIKQAKIILEKHQFQVLSNSKLAALGEMSSGIAHEINNPLAIILGKTRILKNKLSKETIDIPQLQLDIDKIESTTLRISNIVKSMKALSRNNDIGTREPVFVRSMLDDIMAVSKEHLATQEITATFDVQEKHFAWGHGGLLSQVFMNLLKNSIDAISSTKLENEKKWIRVSSVDLGDTIQIKITDSGTGISKEIQDKIMLPFFTTKEAGKGTGLGLSLCRNIIESHKGRFYYDSECPNTCFVIELPKYESAEIKNAA